MVLDSGLASSHSTTSSSEGHVTLGHLLPSLYVIHAVVTDEGNPESDMDTQRTESERDGHSREEVKEMSFVEILQSSLSSSLFQASRLQFVFHDS
jgi:hypothetical protein